MFAVTSTAVSDAEVHSDGVGDTLTIGDFIFTVLDDGTAKVTRYIGNDADVVIPSNLGGYEVTVIGKKAFYYLSVESITFPNTVITIEEESIYSCDNLKTIIISESIKYLDANFYDSGSFEKYIVDINNPYYYSEDGVLFNKDMTVLLDYPLAKKDSFYRVPKSVETIKDICSYNLDYLEITENVSKIETDTLAKSYLYDITVAEDNSYFSSEDGVLFNKDKTRLIRFPHKKEITSYTVPDSVYRIWDYAFNMSKLNHITLNDGLKYINQHAFEGACLYDLVIPDSVIEVGEYAFRNMDYCTEITLSENLTIIKPYTFNGCTELLKVDIPDKITSIGEWAFRACISLTEVNFSDELICIGAMEFDRCRSLTKANIPEKVTSIEEWAFRDCSGLTEMSLPDGMTSIGEGVFLGCSSLEKVNVPQGLTIIDWQVFQDCELITEVTIPSNVSIISGNAFAGCTSLEKVIIPSSVTKIYGDAFLNCEALTIYGFLNTAAHTYAVENNIPFVAMIMGDVNFDGVVNIIDATEIQKAVSGITSFSEESTQVADVNGDGVVNISDATMIQKYCVGLAEII